MSDTPTYDFDAGVLTLHLPPSLTASNASTCFSTFKQAITESEPKEVRLDLDGVANWDMTGLAALRQLHKICRRDNIAWELSGGTDEVTQGVLTVSDDTLLATSFHLEWTTFPTVVGERTIRLWKETLEHISFVGELSYGLMQAILHPRQVRWAETLKYMDRTGTDALPIVTLITFLMGLILGFQSALQMEQYGAETLVANLVGLSIVRELGPLMVAMICTGRAGSAFAAEIGTMKVSEEVDALVTMGLEPTRFLIMPKVIALTLVMPLLTIFGDLMGIFGGLMVGILALDMSVVSYVNRTLEALQPWDFGEGLVKSVVFAVLISGIGCLRGLQARDSAQEVGKATTSAVVSGIFLIIVADTILAFIFSRLVHA